MTQASPPHRSALTSCLIPILPMTSDFQNNGFLVVESVLPLEELGPLQDEAERLLASSPERGGARNGLQRSGALRRVAESPVLVGLASGVLDCACRPVKLTVFDKTEGSNWKVPWHQDLTITVAERREVPGFGPWSEKGGLPHVQPPVEVLEAIVALRIHLDATPAENGALRVLAGTHRRGRLDAATIRSLARDRCEVVVPVPAGGVMAMSPLLLHASSPSKVPGRRRVLHVEYASAELMAEMGWAWPT